MIGLPISLVSFIFIFFFMIEDIKFCVNDFSNNVIPYPYPKITEINKLTRITMYNSCPTCILGASYQPFTVARYL